MNCRTTWKSIYEGVHSDFGIIDRQPIVVESGGGEARRRAFEFRAPLVFIAQFIVTWFVFARLLLIARYLFA